MKNRIILLIITSTVLTISAQAQQKLVKKNNQKQIYFNLNYNFEKIGAQFQFRHYIKYSNLNGLLSFRYNNLKDEEKNTKGYIFLTDYNLGYSVFKKIKNYIPIDLVPYFGFFLGFENKTTDSKILKNENDDLFIYGINYGFNFEYYISPKIGINLGITSSYIIETLYKNNFYTDISLGITKIL